MRILTEGFKIQVPVEIDAVRPALGKSFPKKLNSLLLLAKE